MPPCTTIRASVFASLLFFDHGFMQRETRSRHGSGRENSEHSAAGRQRTRRAARPTMRATVTRRHTQQTSKMRTYGRLTPTDQSVPTNATCRGKRMYTWVRGLMCLHTHTHTHERSRIVSKEPSSRCARPRPDFQRADVKIRPQSIWRSIWRELRRPVRPPFVASSTALGIGGAP